MSSKSKRETAKAQHTIQRSAKQASLFHLAAYPASPHAAHPARRLRRQPRLSYLRRPPHPALHVRRAVELIIVTTPLLTARPQSRTLRPHLRPRVPPGLVPHRAPLAHRRAARAHARPARLAVRAAPPEVLSALPCGGRGLSCTGARVAGAWNGAARGGESVERSVCEYGSVIGFEYGGVISWKDIIVLWSVDFLGCISLSWMYHIVLFLYQLDQS